MPVTKDIHVYVLETWSPAHESMAFAHVAFCGRNPHSVLYVQRAQPPRRWHFVFTVIKWQ
jgi:hypothetical protein